MSDVLSFLNIKFPQEPYSNSKFLEEANCLLSSNSDWSVERKLVELSIFELQFFAQDEFEEIVYRAHMRQLYNWANDKHTVYVDKVFKGLSSVGLPVLPAFQKILSIVSGQHLNRSEPNGNASLKVVSQEEHKKYALILVAQLMFYLGDGIEKATNKAAARIHAVFGGERGVRGCSAENLERLFDKSYSDFVRDSDGQMNDDDRLDLVKELSVIPDNKP